jgi:hypothetical protein
MPPRIVIISLPCGLEVSHQPSARNLNPAPALAMASKTFRRSLVERARSSQVTNKTFSCTQARESAT